MPAASAEARTKTIKAALEAANAKADAERIRLPWKDETILATVVNIQLASVVLNPGSHRIRAQLESATKGALVQRDPFGDEAQELIAALLRQTDDFEKLKNNLESVGQTDPGVVTHAGMLVNANTRCVALADLKKRFIRVAVLPEDATEEEIDRLELNLQRKQDFRRDYTFTNDLLFVDDLIKKYKHRNTDVALLMGWASATEGAALKKAAEQTQQYLRMLTLIREVQQISGGAIKLTFFDAMKQAISELDDEYENLKKRAPDAAKKLRDTRLMALLAGVGYRELREIDDKFLEKYLLPAMEDQPTLKGKVESVLKPPARKEDDEDIPGLDVLEGEGSGNGNGEARLSVEPLLSRLAQSAGDQQIVIENGKGPASKIPRAAFVEDLKRAVESGAEDSKLEKTEVDLLDRPRLLLRRAIKQVRASMEAYRRAQARDGFDEKAVRKAVEELVSAQKALVALIDGSE